MKLKLAFLFLLVQFPFLAQCPPGDVEINSQAEVIAFAAEYPNCTQINGFLSMIGSDITDLTPLNNIEIVIGSLNINSTAITNGNIFNNLTTVIGLLNIQNNPNLTQISGFNAFVNGSTVQINSNTNLTQITGFTSLTTLSNNLSFIGAIGSPVLNDISGFSNVESIGYLLVRNTGLTNLSSLSSLQAINLGLSIDQNPNLISIAALNNCTNAIVGNGSLPFRIFNNPLLQSLEGINFSSVTNTFDVQIYNLPLVQNIDQLSCLEGNFPALMIRDMSNLQNLNGLSNITSIGSLTLSNLALVNSLPSWNLSQLNAFTISNNAQLSSISSLSNVLVLGSGAEITAINLTNNPQLINLNGLHNLVSLSNKSVSIVGNTALSDISALNNLNINTLNGITLTGNTSLSTCSEEWICERLNLNLNSINITNNANGCESVFVVQSACNDLSASDFELKSNVRIYPNPFKNSFNIELGQDVSDVKINLFDSTGKHYYSKMHFGETIEINQLDSLSNGVYFVIIEFENGNTITQKIIK